jgi:hydrogenase expression/formation protein HypE
MLDAVRQVKLSIGREHITMLHGAGGSVMHDLIENYIIKYLRGESKAEVPLEYLDDAAVVDDIAIKSDSHAVKPIFFPGGDIGRLSVSGTVNDLSCIGSQPFALACGLILEEGLLMETFERILFSMKKTCEEAGVSIVTGDTKVVEKGSLGGCVINMSGIGKRTQALEQNLEGVKCKRPKFKSRWILNSNIREGDKIIVSGTMGDHGIAVLSAQEGLSFGSSVRSDVAPLNCLIQNLLGHAGGIVAMKDPTRGGLADALNELSEKSNVGILTYEEKIPVKDDVKAACDMFGLDPFEIGNEGKIIIATLAEKADEVLEALQATKEGKDSQIIGEATSDFEGVAIQTAIGGNRIMAQPVGDPVPRIC